MLSRRSSSLLSGVAWQSSNVATASALSPVRAYASVTEPQEWLQASASSTNSRRLERVMVRLNRARAPLPAKATSLKRLPPAHKGAVLQEQVGNVSVAVAHGLVQGIHAIAVSHVEVGLAPPPPAPSPVQRWRRAFSHKWCAMICSSLRKSDAVCGPCARCSRSVARA